MTKQRKWIGIRRYGMILPLAAVIIVVLAFIGIGLIQLGRNARLQAIKDTLKVSARCAADAGVEHAVRYMIDQWNGATNKTAWINTAWYDATAWTDPAIPATAEGYSFGTVNMSGTYGDSKFQYKIYKGTRAKGYQIVSTGTAGGMSETVHAAVVLRSAFFGIGAKRNIYISPNTVLGTIPANDDFIIQTNSINSDAIILKPGISVPGDVVCGPGGDPDIAIDLAKNSYILGDDRASEDYIDFPPVYRPALPAGSLSPNASAEAYITSDIELNGLTLGSGINKLYVTGNPAVNGGEVKVFVKGFTYMAPGSELIVTKGTKLTLYLGGNIDVKGGTNGAIIIYDDGIFTSDAEKIEAAKAISIKGTTDPATNKADCTNIQFFPKGDFYGTIYAPDANPLYLAPNGNFCGAVIGSDSITLKPGGTFMYIPSLMNLPDVEVLYMGIKHGSWWED